MITFFIKISLKLIFQFFFWTIIFSMPWKNQRIFDYASTFVTQNPTFQSLEKKVQELVLTTVDSAKRQVAKLPVRKESSEF